MTGKIKRLILFGTFFLLISIHLILALDTQVIVKTSLNRAVHIRFLDTDKGGTLPLGYIINYTNVSETVTAGYSSDLVNYVDVSVMLRDTSGNLIKLPNGEALKVFPDLKTGWIYYIDLTTSEPIALKGASTNPTSATPSPTPIPIVNDSLQNNSITVTPSPVEVVQVSPTPSLSINSNLSNPVTNKGWFSKLKEQSSNNKKTIIWVLIIVAVLIVIIVVFLILIFKKEKDYYGGKKDNFKVVKLSNIKKEREDADIRSAQERLLKAQDDFNRVKDKKMKIVEAEKKLDEDRRYLEKLRKGY